MDSCYVLKNSTNRTDILLLIFHISTYKSSCLLYTCEGDLRVPSTIIHGKCPIQWKIANRRLSSVHFMFPHGIFSVCKKNPAVRWTSQYRLSTFLHPIYHVTSILVELTHYIPHFYMDFFYVLKNFTNRTDTLILNIHISTCKSSCYLFTSELDLRVLSTILHGLFPI